MKKYGIIMADNGSAWYISGKPDPRWNNDSLRSLSQLLGSNFEAVDATVLRISPDSGAARQSGVSVTVSPSSAAVRVGNLKTFAAAVGGGQGGVSWSVNDIAGGDAIVGTIDSNGVYLAPPTVPSPSVVTVRATSVATPTASGTASVTILPQPSIMSVSPSSFTTGPFSATVNGAGFVTGAVVTFDGVALPTTFVSPAKLTVTGTAGAAKPSVPVIATMPDGAASNVAFVDLTGPAPGQVSITIAPASAWLRVKRSLAFTANVQGTANLSVTWKVNGITGGNASVGTISKKGIYQAPASVPSPAAVTVSGTAVADPTKTATASVTIYKPS
jgi:hypothetical protein